MRKSVFNLFLIILVLFGAYYVIAGINNVTLDSPTGAANVSNVSGSTFTFQCTAVPNATEYVGNISLGFNFSDAGAPNGSIILNVSQNLSNGTNTSVFIFNTGTLREGRYLWSCLAANTTGNGVVGNRTFNHIQADNNGTTNGSAKASGSNGTILVDGTGPSNITLVFPGSTTNLTNADFTNGSVTVVWKVNDAYMTNSVCNVTVNGVVRSPINVIGVSNNSANFSALVTGFTSLVANTWSVSCTDHVGNANATGSGSRTINITDATVPTINGIDQKLKFKGTVNGQRDVEATIFDFGSPIDILGCNGTDNVDYFNTNATIYVRRPGASVFAIERNDTGGISNFEFTDTEALGFYEVNCTIRDNAGNQNSTAKRFEIIRSNVRRSGAAAIPGFHFTKGKTIVGSDTKNEAGALTTTDSSWLFRNGGTVAYLVTGESHSFQVTNIGENSVTIRVSSNPFDVTINKDETKNVDVNGDGSADVAITLNGFSANGNADITFKEVGTGVTADAGPGTENGGQVGTTPGAVAAGNGMWMVIAIIVVVLVVGYFLIKRR